MKTTIKTGLLILFLSFTGQAYSQDLIAPECYDKACELYKQIREVRKKWHEKQLEVSQSMREWEKDRGNYPDGEIYKQKYGEYSKRRDELSAERNALEERRKELEREFCIAVLSTDEGKEVMRQMLANKKTRTVSNIHRVYLDSVLVRSLRNEAAGYDKEKMRHSYQMIHQAINYSIESFIDHRKYSINNREITDPDSIRRYFPNAKIKEGLIRPE